MRKVILYLSFLVLLTILSGCRKEKEVRAPSEEPGWTTVHLRATASEEGGKLTRATLDQNDRHYIFEQDDKLYVVDSDTGGDKLYGFLYLISGAGATEAVFEGDLMYFDPVSKEPGEPESGYSITATLVSKSQLDAGIYTVSNGKITSAGAPAPIYGNAVAATFKEAVQKYSHFKGDATYGDPSFSLGQQSAFLLFNFSFDDNLGSGDLTFTMTNNSSTVRTITVTPNAYKQAIFVAVFPSQTTLTDASVAISGGGLSVVPRTIRNATLQANRYYNVNRTFVNLDYFTIHTGSEATTINFNYSVQYSTDDGSTWNDASGAIPVAANASIKVRGNSNTYKDGTLFTSSNACYIYGDIMSLFYDSSYSTKRSTLAESALSGTFKEMTNIDILPGRPLQLSATTLGNNSYYQMFYGCTGLTNAPEFTSSDGQFAATIPRKACYEMFAGCTALTAAPDLPASNVQESGYYGMFRGCSSLILPPSALASTFTNTSNFQEMFINCTALLYAPELPSTSVPNNGYRSMFSGCTSLTSAPALPATSLGTSAYYRMFENCSSMATGPSELPATEMKSSCYSGMFMGCTSLGEAPEIKATTLAESCFNQMFQNCKVLRRAQTEFYFTNIVKNSCNKMFMGCLALNNAPNMPSVAGTVGENGCLEMYRDCGELVTTPSALTASAVGTSGYNKMFYNCIKLKTSPRIDATDIGQNGCYSMFQGCTRLQTPPALPATNLGTSAYRQMFYGCKALVTPPPALPATTLGGSVYYQMFYGCTSLKSAPAFPVTDAAISGTQSCYQMFYNCQSITELTGQLFGAGSTLSTECFRQMFQNCTSLKTVPQGFLPATSLAASCYRGMFESTAIERAPDLLVETLNAGLCYQYMFNKCNKLTYVKCLATNPGDGSAYTSNWLNGVASTGTFVQAEGVTWPTGVHGIPSGWTVTTP